MDVGERGGVWDLWGFEGGETDVGIYCIKDKSIFNFKKYTYTLYFYKMLFQTVGYLLKDFLKFLSLSFSPFDLILNVCFYLSNFFDNEF